MSKVIYLNNVTNMDIPPQRVLDFAISANLTDVVILGYDAEGAEYFASSIADGADVLWMLERCKKKLLEIVDNGEF